jgi:uncharacterized protein YndB with AHSA1/START domain
MSTEQSTEQHILTMTREFDAPRELVFAAFTDPDQLAAWFGPVEVESPRDRIVVEPRVGGVWQLVMTWTQDGAPKEGPIDAVITAYDPPALLVATQKAEPGGGVTPGPEMRFEFEDLGGRTRLHLTQGPFGTAEFLEMTRGGWGSSFTKLDAILA